MNEDWSYIIADEMLERPHGFSVNGVRMSIYPITLGKRILLSRLYALLPIDFTVMAVSADLEALRIVMAEREAVCRIIAYHTLANKKEAFDTVLIHRRTELLKEADDNDLASLFLVLLNADKTAQIAKHLGIDRENERYRRAASVIDKDSGTFQFGMVSDYGRLLDFACQRYHWTLDYVMWGISYTNLQLMIADSEKSLYLDKDERRRARVSNDRSTINGDNKASWATIKSMNWD